MLPEMMKVSHPNNTTNYKEYIVKLVGRFRANYILNETGLIHYFKNDLVTAIDHMDGAFCFNENGDVVKKYSDGDAVRRPSSHNLYTIKITVKNRNGEDGFVFVK